MKTFDDLTYKAQLLIDMAGKKSNEVIELSRLKVNRSKIKSNIDDEYKKLGSAFYKIKRENYNDEDHVNSICDKIDKLYYDLDEIELKISNLKNTKVCKCCSHKNPTNSEYCSSCGVHLSDMPKDDDKTCCE